MKLLVVRLDPELPLPSRAHPGDAGLDLYLRRDIVLHEVERRLVATGISVAIPYGYVGLVHPRSSLAHRSGIGIVNAPGVIDAGYRGEIMVNLINHGADSVWLNRGDRIAQLLIQRVELADPIEVESLDETARGTGGHGSTGI